MSSSGKPASLHEMRSHGSISFPCAMYRADDLTLTPGLPFITRLHWHNAIEFLYFEEGTFQVTVNGKVDHFAGGSFCFIESGALHAIRSEKGYRERAFVFDPSLILDESGGSDLFPGRELKFPGRLCPQDPGFTEFLREYRALAALFDRFGSCGDTKDQQVMHRPGAQLRVRACLYNMLAILLENGHLTRSLNTADPRIDSLKQVILYIQNHFQSKIYLKDLSQIMNMNEQYFCRYFKKATGKTPVSYINELRLKKAASLLSDPRCSHMSVLEIAGECGYGNMAHFISQFRAMAGCPPQEYRKRSAAADTE